MAMATLTSTCNPGIGQTFCLDNNNNNNKKNNSNNNNHHHHHLRDASFSCYLNSAEESLIRKLSESSGSLSHIMISQENHRCQESKNEDDGEIGVFGAEKYFNGGMDEESPKRSSLSARKSPYVNHEQVDMDSVKLKLQHGTPSIRSESSGNSQSTLLQNVPRNPWRRKTNKGQRKNFLAHLGCSCSCSDKDSVDIDEHVGEVQGKISAKESIKTGLDLPNAISVNQPRKDLIRVQEDPKVSREKCFSLPRMNSSAAGNLPVKMQEKVLELPRKSLEVFGSPVLDKNSKPLSLEGKLSMLSWNTTPRVEKIDYSAKSSGIYDDNDSDASSDLFEIDSLSGKASYCPAMQASDVTSGCVTPTTCYAPSEASIEWSVVTASAADFSVTSDWPPTTMPSPIKSHLLTPPNAKTTTSREAQRRRPSILLGCNSQKSTRVAGDTYRTNDKANFDPRMRRVSDSFMPVTRLPAGTEPTGPEFRLRQPALATTRSQPPRSSHLVYIQ